MRTPIFARQTPLPSRRPVAAGCRDERPLFILLGGVPGAGKSTVLACSAPDLIGVRALDPEVDGRRIAAALPDGVPYRSYRGVVHTLHAVRSLLTLLTASSDPDLRALLVHEPATRPLRRAALARLARRQGWRAVLVLVDVEREDALAGQRSRGRVLKSSAFDRHWDRWSADRDDLVAAATERNRIDGWDEVHVVDRDTAQRRLHELIR